MSSVTGRRLSWGRPVVGSLWAKLFTWSLIIDSTIALLGASFLRRLSKSGSCLEVSPFRTAERALLAVVREYPLPSSKHSEQHKTPNKLYLKHECLPSSPICWNSFRRPTRLSHFCLLFIDNTSRRSALNCFCRDSFTTDGSDRENQGITRPHLLPRSWALCWCLPCSCLDKDTFQHCTQPLGMQLCCR